MDRRTFLKQSAGAVSATTLLSRPGTARAAGKAAPSERVRLGFVGIRGRGRSLANGFAGLPEAEIVYLCDVDESTFAPALKTVTDKQPGKPPQTVGDFRRILDDKNVDAVVVATPDHWHALVTVLACQAGKDVYVEKPCSHNVREGRIMLDVARKTGRVVQVGTQRRSSPDNQALMEFLRSGKLGKVLVAKAINSQRRANIGKQQDAPVPNGVNYDMWLGPAPTRAFNPNRFHYNWHWNWDYGTGDLGNDGVHQVDVARWGLGVTAPKTVTCHGAKYYFDDDQQTPDTQTVVWDYGDRALMFEQRIWAPYSERGIGNGNVFYCEEGYVNLDRHGWKAFGKDDKPIPVEVPPPGDPHATNFLSCVKSRQRPNADIEEGHYSAMLCHLGNVAYRVGRVLRFDPKTETCIGDDEANRMMTRNYRKPWVMPDKA